MKKMIALLTAGAMAFSLAACSSDAPATTTAAAAASAAAETKAAGSAAGTAAETKAAESAAAASGKEAPEAQVKEIAKVDISGKNVSILTPYLSSVTTKQMADTLQAGLEGNGAKVDVVDSKNDFGQLASDIENVVTAKTDAIILVSADPNQVKNQLADAFSAGIPVFGVDSGFIDGMQVNATSDNYKMGEDMSKYLFEDLMGKKGTVIELTYSPHPGVVKRSNAFDDLLPSYPDIKLITKQEIDVPKGPIESGREIMENLLTANAEKDSITAVFCAWDEPAIGATQALQDAGRDEVMVTGVDGNSQAVDLIKQGTNLKATMSQNFDGMCNIVANDVGTLLSGGTIETGEKYAPGQMVTAK
ncbi:sugar ABC transporter substrate-binding protein [Clostridium vitabionis]|uniref:sugar ABC transporter substrate-binding protein n=1 Tax=Clostridium vitabionis TaxID=2784388 RepID=UPI001F2025F1|nr:substrate-binding domain-containing protein [Clostridium vitabionis]